MRKARRAVSFICVIIVLFSVLSTSSYAGFAEESNPADPSEPISVADAISLLDRAFSEPDAIPSNEQPGSGAAWFDPALVMGRYDTLITRAFASYMLLSAAGIAAPPAALYSASALPEIENVFAAYLRDSFVTCIEMELFRTNVTGNYEPNKLIDKAELVSAVTSLQDRGFSLPEADNIPVISAEVYGFTGDDALYQALVLQSALLAVPVSLAQDFTENGWHIAVASESYYKSYVSSRYSETAYLTASGLYMPMEKTILLQNRATAQAVQHELGHYLARNFTAREDLAGLYDSECASLELLTRSSYCHESPEEFFAEAFRIYVSAPSNLEIRCPLTFAYVDNIICSMDNAA